MIGDGSQSHSLLGRTWHKQDLWFHCTCLAIASSDCRPRLSSVVGFVTKGVILRWWENKMAGTKSLSCRLELANRWSWFVRIWFMRHFIWTNTLQGQRPNNNIKNLDNCRCTISETDAYNSSWQEATWTQDSNVRVLSIKADCPCVANMSRFIWDSIQSRPERLGFE